MKAVRASLLGGLEAVNSAEKALRMSLGSECLQGGKGGREIG